jgi:hypothetical protein
MPSNKNIEILKWSDLKDVIKNKNKYLGEDIPLFLSTRKDKKFMVLNPNTNKYIHFGQMNFEDFTKHKSITRLNNYIKRSSNIKGNWKNDHYSPNNLSQNILWK